MVEHCLIKIIHNFTSFFRYIFNDTVTKTILPQADQMDYKNVEGVNFTNFDKQFNDNKLDIDKEELTVLIKQLQGNVFDDDIFKETIWLNVSNDVSKEYVNEQQFYNLYIKKY